MATQLGIVDDSVLWSSAERSKTPYEHRWEIARVYGYRRLSELETAAEFRSFLTARAWTRAERPTRLYDQGVAWLRAERVLLPGVSAMARLVGEVRGAASDRLYSVLAGRVSPELGRSLDRLLTVPADSRSSGLERLRRAPTRASGPKMARALEPAAEVAGLGAGGVDLSEIPAGRVQVLARYGLSSDAAMLRRMPEHAGGRRWLPPPGLCRYRRSMMPSICSPFSWRPSSSDPRCAHRPRTGCGPCPSRGGHRCHWRRQQR